MRGIKKQRVKQTEKVPNRELRSYLVKRRARSQFDNNNIVIYQQRSV